LWRRSGNAQAAIERLPSLMSGNGAGKGGAVKLPSLSAIEAEFQAIDALNGPRLLCCDPDFPPFLAVLASHLFSGG